MPLVSTRGAASAQGFGEFAQSAAPVYIEDVFSTWLYTGNNSTQTITNGIDLAGKGGLVWVKERSPNAYSHILVDTARGAANGLSSNTTAAQFTNVNSLTAFNSNGFTLNTGNSVNQDTDLFASWTFREQPKFFDVVTYTGNGTSGRSVAHNLGSVPGCIIVKSTSYAGTNWAVYHRSLTSNQYALQLNNTGAQLFKTAYWNSTTPTSSVFTVGNDADVNENGQTYVAYLFAHNAGGFGLTGTDNVITCGSYTGSATDWAAGASLGYEPQWVLIKNITSGTANWNIFDNMRGMFVSSADDPVLFPNLSNAEEAYNLIRPTATGFEVSNSSRVGGAGNTCIYIAIRRGPMKVPTTGTSVFSPIVSSATTGTALTTGFRVDLQIGRVNLLTSSSRVFDRLRGVPSTTVENSQMLQINTDQEFADTDKTRAWGNTGFQMPSGWAGSSTIFWNFQRAPGFFDEVCYVGNDESPTRQITHNLGVTPELGIIKNRTISPTGWPVRCSAAPAGSESFFLNTTDSGASYGGGYIRGFTSTSFTVASDQLVNNSGSNYVAYLFASCPGVSKVGSYTGTGAIQVINCGFTGGARFVLIKARSTTGNWFVWDTARGIVAGNDPYLTLNTTAAQVTTTDWVDTAATGFELSNAGGNLANSNGVSYIFLAIA